LEAMRFSIVRICRRLKCSVGNSGLSRYQGPNDLYPVHESSGRPDEAWKEDKARFDFTFSKWLDPHPRRIFRNIVVAVSTKAEVIEVMTPTHWTMPAPHT